MRRLDELTTAALSALLSGSRPVVALVPVGSVEPHGPHLPLGTDTVIGEGAIWRAAARLAGVCEVVIAPAVPYGVTDFARGFAGAVTVPAAVVTGLLRAISESLVGQGFASVCLVSNHLEPAHDAAVRAAVSGLARATVASPLERRWARLLSEEFKSGECHAGRYETSIVLACRPELVDDDLRAALPDVPISLSRGIQEGKDGFSAMGMTAAYAGAPRLATAAEGEAQLARLAEMIETTVRESLVGTVT